MFAKYIYIYIYILINYFLFSNNIVVFSDDHCDRREVQYNKSEPDFIFPGDDLPDSYRYWYLFTINYTFGPTSFHNTDSNWVVSDCFSLYLHSWNLWISLDLFVCWVGHYLYMFVFLISLRSSTFFHTITMIHHNHGVDAEKWFRILWVGGVIYIYIYRL